MAKRADLDSKLSGGAPGWRDMIPKSAGGPQPRDGDGAAPARARRDAGAGEKKVRKTYYLREATIARIDEISAQERVGISDLVEFGLTRFLDQLESGEIKLKTETREVRQIIF